MQPRAFRNEVSLQKLIEEGQEYSLLKINDHNLQYFPSSLMPLLQLKNIKIVNNGCRKYLSGNQKHGILLVVDLKGEILAEISPQASIPSVASYSYYSPEFHQSFHKVVCPVVKQATTKGPVSKKNKRKLTMDIVKEIKVAPPTEAKGKAAPVPLRDPCKSINHAILDFNKKLYLFSITKNRAYLVGTQHSLRLMAHLVEESYRVKVREWVDFKRRTQDFALQEHVLHHVAYLEATLQAIVLLGKQIMPDAIRLIQEDLMRVVSMKSPDSIIEFIQQDLSKLNTWLIEVKKAGELGWVPTEAELPKRAQYLPFTPATMVSRSRATETPSVSPPRSTASSALLPAARSYTTPHSPILFSPPGPQPPQFQIPAISKNLRKM